MHIKSFLESPPGRVMKPADWARRFDITRGYLHQLAHRGKIPSLPVALIIHKRTDGAVTPFDWETEDGGSGSN